MYAELAGLLNFEEFENWFGKRSDLFGMIGNSWSARIRKHTSKMRL